MRQRTRALVVVVALTPGLGLLGLVALAADPAPTVVTFSPSGQPSPSATVLVPPGAFVQFSVSPGGSALAIERRETPFALDTTIEAGASVSPTPLGVAAPTDLAFTVRPLSPLLALPGPTQGGVLRVTPSAVVTTAAAPAPTVAAGSVAAPTSTAPATSAAPARTPSAATSRKAATGTARATPRRTTQPSAVREPSPLATGSPRPQVVVPPGAVLPSAAIVPSFAPTPAGPAPQLYDPSAEPAPVAGAITTPPALASGSSSPSAARVDVGPPYGLAGQSVPARRRGLPLSVAVVLLLGVGGAVGRAVVAVGRRG